MTEEGLTNMVCASVKDYLGGVTDYVARCQQRVAELEETLGIVMDEKHALQRQVEELIEKDDVTKRDTIDALGRV